MRRFLFAFCFGVVVLLPFGRKTVNCHAILHILFTMYFYLVYLTYYTLCNQLYLSLNSGTI